MYGWIANMDSAQSIRDGEMGTLKKPMEKHEESSASFSNLHP